MAKSTLPHFLRDFHDQKDFVKAFYTWLQMMDTMQEKVNGKKFDGILHPRRVDMTDWVSFSVLFVSCVDFMNQLGYRIQKKAGEGEDFHQDVKDLKEFPLIFDSIRDASGPLAFKAEYCVYVLSRWENWLVYMPDDIMEFYNANKKP